MWHARSQPLTLRTTVGEIKLKVWYGLDPAVQSWGSVLGMSHAPALGLDPAATHQSRA